MPNQPRTLNILLAAEESPGSAALRHICSSGHHVVAVLTTAPGDPQRSGVCWNAAQALGCQTLPTASATVEGLAGIIRRENVDILLCVHSLFIMAREVLNAPRIGCFNLHPGPLPRYAGLNSPSWAIYRGEKEHGVTLHHMTTAIDAGPIAYQRMFPIADEDIGLSLATRCVQEGQPLLRKLLEVAAVDSRAIPHIAQDLGRREYFNGHPPMGGWLDFSRTAREVVNFLRAACYHPFRSPWGHPKTLFAGAEVGVVTGSLTGLPAGGAPGVVTELSTVGAVVCCADESIVLQRIRFGGDYCNAAEVLKPGALLGPAVGSKSPVCPA
ncbi:MAG: luciferase-like monooxygenase family [Phycisphaerales bacterium]|nr:luciferase-like monooxygenase family [Phycisphaerales bacterium]